MPGFDEIRLALMDEYFRHTRELLPAQAAKEGWPATEEAHFQRIILDNLVGGVWYGKIKEPAVLHLSKGQLRKAIGLAKRMLDGEFAALNEASLNWRSEKGVPPELELYGRDA
jgi:hypothetical protein